MKKFILALNLPLLLVFPCIVGMQIGETGITAEEGVGEITPTKMIRGRYVPSSYINEIVKKANEAGDDQSIIKTLATVKDIYSNVTRPNIASYLNKQLIIIGTKLDVLLLHDVINNKASATIVLKSINSSIDATINKLQTLRDKNMVARLTTAFNAIKKTLNDKLKSLIETE